MQLKDITAYHTYIIQKLATDVLAEEFAAMLINDNIVEEDDLHLLPSDVNARNFKNDITYFKNIPDENYENRYLEIGLSRLNILNALPESFFVEYDNSDAKTQEEKQRKRDDFNEKLSSAKKFFRPVEIEYNKTRIKKALNEQILVSNSSNLLYSFWGEQKIGSQEEQRVLKTMHILPYVIGNKEKTEKLINYVLEKNTQISYYTIPISNLDKEEQVKLGEWHLAINTYLNNQVYSYERFCNVTISNIENEEFHLYYKRTKKHGIILNKIAKFYFPIDVNVEYKFKINYETSFFKLGEVYENGNGILGYSTRI